MDTAPYSNILKAVGQTTPAQPKIEYTRDPSQTALPSQSQTFSTAPKLTLDQQAENYNMFSEMMKQGVYLPDLVKKVDVLTAEVESLKTKAKTEVDTDLFEAMEASVKGVPEVKAAKQHMADIKSAVITELCMKDPRFQEAYDEYRRAVNKAYIDRAETRSDREGAVEVCKDAGGPHCDP